MSLTVTDPVAAPPAAAELARLRARVRAGIWVEALGGLALLLLAFAALSLPADRLLRLERPFRAGLLATCAVVVAVELRRRLVRPLAVPLDDVEMALAVERRAPGIRQALVSSLQFARELRAGDPGPESPALKAAVVADVRARVAAIPFAAAIDGRRVRRFGAWFALAGLVFGGWAAVDAGSLRIWAARNLLLADADWPRRTTLALADGVLPSLRLPQGDPLTLRVVAQGTAPDEVVADYRFATGESGRERLARTGEAEFTWMLAALLADVELSLRGGDSLPLTVRVAIVERPRIDDLELTIVWPEYMQRAPEAVPATHGELRLVRGCRLGIAGSSQKDLASAVLTFGEQRAALAVGDDRRTFAGEFAPEASGTLSVDVLDQDRLGAAAPPRLLLRLADDRPPTVEFRLRGIGASISAHARIPGELRVRDDFGLRDVVAWSRASADPPADRGQEPLPEPPFTPALAAFTPPLDPGAVRYEASVTVDLLQWNKEPAEDAPGNPLRPGMLLSLRFVATDNFGPGAPHESSGETIVFRIVSRDKLTEELRRRQVEQRQELVRIVEDERRVMQELAEIVDPTAAGERRQQVEARLRTLSRQQQALGRRVAMVGELYQRILLEYENNRLWQPAQVRQFEALIPGPLAALARDAFPASARAVEDFAASPGAASRAAAVDACREILRRLEAVLKEMEQAESLAALIEELRAVIRLEQEAIQDVQGRVRDRERDIFSPRSVAPDRRDEKK